jgi:hypothetical protein
MRYERFTATAGDEEDVYPLLGFDLHYCPTMKGERRAKYEARYKRLGYNGLLKALKENTLYIKFIFNRKAYNFAFIWLEK